MLDWNAFTIDLKFCIDALSLGSTHELLLACIAVVMVVSYMEVVKVALENNI